MKESSLWKFYKCKNFIKVQKDKRNLFESMVRKNKMEYNRKMSNTLRSDGQ